MISVGIFISTVGNSILNLVKNHAAIQNLQNSQDYIFHILQYFATKLHNFTEFRIPFSAVLMNVLNSKVCLKGESSISQALICKLEIIF